MTHTDDQRVVDALRAHTGGLIVTEHDITVAEDRLRSTLEPPSPRRRLAVLAAAAAAVLVVGFFVARALDGDEDSAPPAHTSTPAETLEAALQADAYALRGDDFLAGEQPTAEDLVGFWMLREPFASTLIVDGDGSWWMGPIEAPGASGQSTLESGVWTRQLDDKNMCAQGEDFHGLALPWHAALATDNSLRLDLGTIQGTCTPADNLEVWDPVRPGSPLAQYLLTASEDAGWHAAPLTFQWRGMYVAPATGHVLEVLDGEHYRYYETFTEASLTPTEEGRIYFDGRTIGTCGAGGFNGSVEITQLPGVPDLVGSYEAVKTANTGSCDPGLAAEQIWVKVGS